MPPSPLHLLPADTYLAMIRGSVGSAMYRHNYALTNGVREDLVRGGERSCAFYVSHILLFFQVIREPHLRVAGTVRDLLASGWQPTSTPKSGDIVVWEEQVFSGSWEGVAFANEPHPHIGFYLSPEEAISNSPANGGPTRHHLTFGTKDDGSPKVRVQAFYTHPTFFQECSERKNEA